MWHQQVTQTTVARGLIERDSDNPCGCIGKHRSPVRNTRRGVRPRALFSVVDPDVLDCWMQVELSR